MRLPIQYLNPTVLACRRFDGYSLLHGTKFAPRMVYDYELEFYIRSNGGIIIDGEYTPFKAGDINIRKPGQQVQGVPRYECYTLCVDLLGNENRSQTYQFGSEEEAQVQYDNPLLNQMPNKLVLSKKNIIANLMENILQNYSCGSDLAYFQVKSSLYFLFSELFQEIQKENISGNTIKIREAVKYIQNHFTEQINIIDLVEASGFCKSFFHQQFKLETGITPAQLIATLRIDKAKHLLSLTQSEVGMIGSMCGYPDSVYFTRVFKQHTGFTPTDYRRHLKIP